MRQLDLSSGGGGFACLILLIISVLFAIPRAVCGQALYGWGQGGYGNLGNGAPANLYSPTPSPVLSSDISAFGAGGQGYGFSVAVKDGHLYGFGYSQYGQYGNTGSIDTYTPRPITNIPTGVITGVATGAYHTLIIQDGGALGIGLNGYGELGLGNRVDNPPAYTPVQSMSSGVSQVVAGTYFSMAVKDGAAYTWGYNGFGAIGDGTNVDRLVPTLLPGLSTGVTRLACANVGNGALAGFAIQAGALYSWGYNIYGQLGDGTKISHLMPSVIAVLSSGVTDVSAGNNACLAVKNGQVYSWGTNDHGQLGDGTMTNHFAPTLVAGLSNIVAVAESGTSSFALSGDGSLWSWGYNGFGDLGLGDTINRLSPVHLLPPSGHIFTGISMSQDSVLASVDVAPEPCAIGMMSTGAIVLLGRRRSH